MADGVIFSKGAVKQIKESVRHTQGARRRGIPIHRKHRDVDQEEAVPFWIMFQDEDNVKVRDGVWTLIGADDYLWGHSIPGAAGGGYLGDPEGFEEDLAPSGGWAASTDYIVYALLESATKIAGRAFTLSIKVVTSESALLALVSSSAGRCRYKTLGRVSTDSSSKVILGSLVQLHTGGNIGLDNVSGNQFRVLHVGEKSIVVTAGTWTIWERDWDAVSSVWYENENTEYPITGGGFTWGTPIYCKFDVYCSEAFDCSTWGAGPQGRHIYLKLDRTSGGGASAVLTVEQMATTFLPVISNSQNILWRKIAEVSYSVATGVEINQTKSGSVETYSHHRVPSTFDTATRPSGTDSERFRSGSGSGFKLTFKSLELRGAPLERIDQVEWELWFDEDGHLIACPEVAALDVTEDVLSWLYLKDTPTTFSGRGGDYVKCNSGETALEFEAQTELADGSVGDHQHQ